MEEIQLEKNRDEFIRRVENLFCSKKCGDEYVQALLDNDLEKQEECKRLRLKHRACIKHYLEAYDSEETDEGKRTIINSVSGNYEPSQQEIDSI